MARYNKDSFVEDLSLQDVFENASKKRPTEFVEDFFSNIMTRVAEGDEVTIPGFGKFEKYTLASGRVKPKFTAFTDFKAAVNE